MFGSSSTIRTFATETLESLSSAGLYPAVDHARLGYTPPSTR
jgi:hypothetical protein